jgi:hypothetical protein
MVRRSSKRDRKSDESRMDRSTEHIAIVSQITHWISAVQRCCPLCKDREVPFKTVADDTQLAAGYVQRPAIARHETGSAGGDRGIRLESSRVARKYTHRTAAGLRLFAARPD